MPQPYDYFGLMGGAANIGGVNETVRNALLGEQQRQQNANILAQQQAAMEAQQRAAARQQQMQQDLAQLAGNPNARSVGTFMQMYPEVADGIGKGWETISAGQKQAAIKTAADVKGLLDAGDAEGAIGILRAQMESAGATGEDVSSYPQLIEMIRTNPEGARVMANIALAAGMGTDKFAEAYAALGEEGRAAELQPLAVRKAAAEASKSETEATYAPQVVESDLATAKANRDRMAAQTADEIERRRIDWSRLALDEDALATNTQLKLDELHQAAGNLDPGATKAINDAVMSAQESNALADRMDRLADSILNQPMPGGWAASARETMKGVAGWENPVSALRQEYTQLINNEALKSLPPGSASDKDVELVQKGFPGATASPQVMYNFLRGMAKLRRIAAEADNRRANWIAANKSLAPARGDIDVGGVTVPAGTTFNEFDRNAVQRGRQGEAPASIQGIIRKYGSGR